MTGPEQPALFEYGPSRRPAPRMAQPRTGRVQYAKYRPVRRVICDSCVRDIHARGVAVAPFPASVRWRRCGPDGVVELLCQRHKDERRAGE